MTVAAVAARPDKLTRRLHDDGADKFGGRQA